MSTSSLGWGGGWASQSEGTSYCDGDVRNRLLRYQLDVAIEERDHARRIATLSTNMLSEVVAHVMGDDEVHDSTRQGSKNEGETMAPACGIYESSNTNDMCFYAPCASSLHYRWAKMLWNSFFVSLLNFNLESILAYWLIIACIVVNIG